MVCVAITRVTVHLVDTVAAYASIRQLSMYPHSFSFQHYHIEIGNGTAIVINVLIDTTFVRVASGQQRRRNRLFTHTPTHDGEYVHCITNSGANQHHSVRGTIQRKLVKAMELQGSGCRTTFNFASREIRRLIRMRSMSSSVSVTPLELLR